MVDSNLDHFVDDLPDPNKILEDPIRFVLLRNIGKTGK